MEVSPPQRKRWAIPFYYPNFQNDHWRLEGLVFYGDRNHFVETEKKTFKLEAIVAFLKEKGIAFYDTATAVRRLQDNASDKFLEVVEPTDVRELLMRIPECKAIVTTGEKATATICESLSIPQIPKVGAYVQIPGTSLILYRLPSSSRAYPLSLDKKAEYYRSMFAYIGIL